MAPEQWQSLPLDARADIYALGVMLFEMLVGTLPFQADTPYSLMVKHVHEPPPNPRSFRANLPPAIDAVVQKALAKQRDMRFNSAGELNVAFKRALSDQPSETFTPASP